MTDQPQPAATEAQDIVADWLYRRRQRPLATTSPRQDAESLIVALAAAGLTITTAAPPSGQVCVDRVLDALMAVVVDPPGIYPRPVTVDTLRSRMRTVLEFALSAGADR